MRPFFKITILVLAAVTGMTGQAMAQGCAMCTATAGNLDGKAAEGLNLGIVYLGLIPLILMGTIFYKWYKANKHASESES
ncbi:MAG: hypothetical protein BGO09_08635 [Bacteroidetes bacterium 47-18]|nr:MAG: hypothetical protein BGO09_08635 [Bacteroidetes bacterium 47-18]